MARGWVIALEGSLFCDTHHNTVLIAFRGSVGLEEVNGEGWLQDWTTNTLATVFHQLPLQYEYAFDAADHVKEILSDGRFDGLCGSGRLGLIVTGHSKGGAEAQPGRYRT